MAFLSVTESVTMVMTQSVHCRFLRLGDFPKRKLSSSSVSTFVTDKAFVNGEWKSTSSTFPVINPYSGAKIADAANCTKQDTEEAINVASEAFRTWKKTTALKRAEIFQRWDALIDKNKHVLADILTAENGKPIRESKGEIVYAASFLSWCAEEAKRSYGITIPSPHPSRRLMTIKQPVGVAAMITPWNSPSAVITRKACAALAAGCTVVLKPSEDTPFSALALAKLASEAGMPPGVFNVLPASRENAPEVGRVLCTHPSVAALSFTGSTTTGKLLLEQASGTVKKVGMELGGLAPFIVFKTADLDLAVKNVIACKFRYMGQTCVCANRIYVQEEVYDEFVRRLESSMKKDLKMGDPMDHSITFGPLINEKTVLKMEDQVEDAVNKGATIVSGGKRGDLAGRFFEPTLLVDVTSEMKCCSEETFGPLAPVIKFRDEDEVVALANNARVGLAGYFFSNDVAQCWRVAESLEVGMVGVNESAISAAEAPFGGVKESGLGREGSSEALEEYLDVKYICWGV